MEERALDGRRDDGTVDRRGTARGGQAPLGRAHDRRRTRADTLHGLASRGLVHDHAKNVQSVELALAALERVASGALQDVLRAGAEEPREVDRPLGASALTRHVAGEEIVECTGTAVEAVAIRGCDIVGHEAS